MRHERGIRRGFVSGGDWRLEERRVMSTVSSLDVATRFAQVGDLTTAKTTSTSDFVGTLPTKTKPFDKTPIAPDSAKPLGALYNVLVRPLRKTFWSVVPVPWRLLDPL